MKLEDKINEVKVVCDKKTEDFRKSYLMYCNLRNKGLTKQKNISVQNIVSNIK